MEFDDGIIATVEEPLWLLPINSLRGKTGWMMQGWAMETSSWGGGAGGGVGLEACGVLAALRLRDDDNKGGSCGCRLGVAAGPSVVVVVGGGEVEESWASPGFDRPLLVNVLGLASL
jgi:hypothetical protein